ncbi:2-phosphosulfolactate phosphatase [Caldalkalibacillus uzonensis]|uniref:Probable 2-phosphosulfolactate phosphatase n=1 Tax=Caldalkalibacillus uzonensis TaxID=353224 RepID=A0ABU0CXE9_9BACI|nr:2-phosphosulfolactate phosphatase [Caldalkalibacillus uzonensis]MDQ0339947.1 2-phosphosulfolactate phosphatase [Caldalkalibacillus uzonensis]
MGKIHLLFCKEELAEHKLPDKVVIVLDILLATSTIVTVLKHGAPAVIPVLNAEEAKQKAQAQAAGASLLAGEYKGEPLEGFLYPGPVFLKDKVSGKQVILSTTNGTVAIRKSSSAQKVYIGALLNGAHLAQTVVNNHREETILIVCSGSAGAFNLEDFYGAGFIINALLQYGSENWELTDAAQAACLFYESRKGQAREILKRSRVGRMLARHGFDADVCYAAQENVTSIVPCLTSQGTIRVVEPSVMGRMSKQTKD